MEKIKTRTRKNYVLLLIWFRINLIYIYKKKWSFEFWQYHFIGSRYFFSRMTSIHIFYCFVLFFKKLYFNCNNHIKTHYFSFTGFKCQADLGWKQSQKSIPCILFKFLAEDRKYLMYIILTISMCVKILIIWPPTGQINWS